MSYEAHDTKKNTMISWIRIKLAVIFGLSALRIEKNAFSGVLLKDHPRVLLTNYAKTARAIATALTMLVQ